jgi:hypothetical protein
MEAISVLLGVAIVFIAISFVWYTRRMTKQTASLQRSIATLTSSLDEVQRQLENYKRPRTGLLARWVPPKEDESAYVLSIYNDTSERIFNVDLIIPKQYRALCQVYVSANFIDPDSWLEIAMIPKRQEFAQQWFNESFKPIVFSLQYTEAPAQENTRVHPAPFKVSYASKHFSEYLKRLTSNEDATPPGRS